MGHKLATRGGSCIVRLHCEPTTCGRIRAWAQLSGAMRSIAKHTSLPRRRTGHVIELALLCGPCHRGPNGYGIQAEYSPLLVPTR